MESHDSGPARPSSNATITSWTRSRTPNFAIARVMCVLAVNGLITSSRAISSLGTPAPPPHRLPQAVRLDLLGQEPAGPGRERGEHVLVGLERRQDDHPGRQTG